MRSRVSGGHEAEIKEELDLKAKASNVLNDEEAVDEVKELVDKGYDFERMIEEAMQNEKYGATPAVQPPPGSQPRSGGGATGPSAVDSALGESSMAD